MKGILIILAVIIIALFTGTWIFGGLEWLFNLFGNVFGFLSKIFNVFGWSSGVF